MLQFSICNQDAPVFDTSIIHPLKAYAFTELSGNIKGSLIFKYFIKSCVLFHIEKEMMENLSNSLKHQYQSYPSSSNIIDILSMMDLKHQKGSNI